MRALRFIVSGFSAATLVLIASATFGQTYPSKNIRIVTTSIGGSSDFTTRLIAQRISGPLGQNVIVENRASNVVGEMLANARPDGYTLLLTGGAVLLGPLLQKVNFDPVRDFEAITVTTSEPNILVVHPSVPAKSVKELIALAKAKPGALNYASGGTGSSVHLSAELFKSMGGINLMNVNYKGGSLALISVLSGDEVQVMFPSAGTVASHIKSGKLRGLGVTTLQPSSLVPGMPTVAATGLPGYESVSLDFIYAPAKTPTAIITRLNQEIVRILNQPDVMERHFNLAKEVVSSSPEKAAALVKSEIAKWGKVIKDAGIHTQ